MAFGFVSDRANDKNFEIADKLTAGYGSMWGQDPTKPGSNIGPEFTFGLTMDAALDEPLLIIKAAWGGKSLHTDFRSPSAGPYQLSSFQLGKTTPSRKDMASRRTWSSGKPRRRRPPGFITA